jgi:hypothetical protein
MTSDVETRLRIVEDKQRIAAVKHRYCALCDDHYNASELAALFTTDGVWEADGYGRYVGRDAIHEFFASMSAAVSFSAHLVLNEEISVRGDEAKAKWRAIIPATFRIDGKPAPHWLFSEYDDELRRESGHWRFLSMRSIVHRSSPHHLGWD